MSHGSSFVSRERSHEPPIGDVPHPQADGCGHATTHVAQMRHGAAMTRDCKTCEPSTLCQPRRLFEELQRRRLLVPGPDLAVVITNELDERVLGISELPAVWADEMSGSGDEVRAAILSAGGLERRAGPCDKTVVLVRRRLGRTVPLPHDFDGWIAWLNGHQGTDVYAGEWFLVTDHGWRSLMTHAGPAGAEPKLSDGPALRVA
jgi:hypothetical protein